MLHTDETVTAAVRDRIDGLVKDLASRNGVVRQRARKELCQLGKPAGPALARALKHRDENVRWEAAKALAHIQDPKAAPALVQCLMDEVFEVQWLAAEALIALGKHALIPLLEAITTNYGSVFLRQGAHHVLHALERRGLLDADTQLVIDELRYLDPLEPYPIGAQRALDSLRRAAAEPERPGAPSDAE
jgi:HEAT repeat protein